MIFNMEKIYVYISIDLEFKLIFFNSYPLTTGLRVFFQQKLVFFYLQVAKTGKKRQKLV